MNRIILKVKMKSDKLATITLVYIDNRFLSTGNGDFKTFYEPSQDFMIYSYDRLTYTSNTLKLPSLSSYVPCQSIDVYMESKDKMQKWLKSLYNTLQLWNDNYTEFKKSSDYEIRPKKLLLSDENWIL